MAPGVSMWYTQQVRGWDIAYKILGPHGIIHMHLQEPCCQRIGIFASNTYVFSGDHIQELLQKYQDAIKPEYPHRSCVIISDDLHCVPDDRIEALSSIGSGVLQSSTGLRHNAFPLSICLTQDFHRSIVVHTLPWPAYSPSGTPSSIGKGLHWLPDKVTWPITRHHGAVMPGNLGGLGWHPTGKNYPSEPIHATEMQISAWAHGLSQQLLTLLHLTACCAEQNATINFCLANDNSRYIADLTIQNNFFGQFFAFIKLTFEIDVRFIFVQYTCVSKLGQHW